MQALFLERGFYLVSDKQIGAAEFLTSANRLLKKEGSRLADVEFKEFCDETPIEKLTPDRLSCLVFGGDLKPFVRSFSVTTKEGYSRNGGSALIGVIKTQFLTIEISTNWSNFEECEVTAVTIGQPDDQDCYRRLYTSFGNEEWQTTLFHTITTELKVKRVWDKLDKETQQLITEGSEPIELTPNQIEKVATELATLAKIQFDYQDLFVANTLSRELLCEINDVIKKKPYPYNVETTECEVVGEESQTVETDTGTFIMEKPQLKSVGDCTESTANPLNQSFECQFSGAVIQGDSGGNEACCSTN